MSIPAFRARFHEFDTLSDPVVEDALAEAAAHHSATELGQLLVAAHLLAIQQEGRPAVAGEITSISLAGQTVTSTPQAERGSESFYASTTYGQRYLSLKKSRSVGAVAVYR